jgi:hypothetical protein
MEMYLRAKSTVRYVISKKKFIVDILNVSDENSRFRIRIRIPIH